jgi:hypothetical protein
VKDVSDSVDCVAEFDRLQKFADFVHKFAASLQDVELILMRRSDEFCEVFQPKFDDVKCHHVHGVEHFICHYVE